MMMSGLKNPHKCRCYPVVPLQTCSSRVRNNQALKVDIVSLLFKIVLVLNNFFIITQPRTLQYYASNFTIGTLLTEDLPKLNTYRYKLLPDPHTRFGWVPNKP